MTDHDPDEVESTLISLVGYVRSYGVHGAQLEKLFAERLQAAFAIADEFEDGLCDAIANSPLQQTIN